ncbi:MAG TPA: hypothetical protein DEA63_02915 [Firmicutes bacterium]|nr:hypothetical protein [Bacillota bacterium]
MNKEKEAKKDLPQGKALPARRGGRLGASLERRASKEASSPSSKGGSPLSPHRIPSPRPKWVK